MFKSASLFRIVLNLVRLSFAALFLASCFLGRPAFADLSESPFGPITNPLWLRYPAISPDGKTIAFTFRGHILTVPASGGVATPLTSGAAHDTIPVWSPDGKLIAYASDRYGHFDVFVVSSQGGATRRLTTYSSDAIPTGFTPDGQFVLFNAYRLPTVESALFPLRIFPQLYKVPIEEGRAAEMILTTPALNAHYDQSGSRILYEDLKGYEDLWRKHETFSVAHDIWLYDAKSGEHKKLSNAPGENRNPVWAPDENAVYYLTEKSGSFNIWRMPITGSGTSEQITKFEKNPVRFLTVARNGDLCFGFDGEIYTLISGAQQPEKVEIQIGVTDNEPATEIKGFGDNATEFALSPNGKEFAVVVRGDIYVAAVDQGQTKRITNTQGQERSVSFSPDGRRLVYAAEYGKAWALYEASIVQPKEKEPYFFNSTVIDTHPLLENDQENFQPKYSPDGKEVAYLENRTTLKVLNLETKQSRLILPGDYNYSYNDGDQWYDWSPDGKWFLVSFLNRSRYSPEAGLIDSEGKQQLTNLTKSGFQNVLPRWMMDGKSMIWLSDHYGLHGYGDSQNTQADVYEMFFTQEAYDRSKLSKPEYDILKEKEDDDKKKKDAEKKDPAKDNKTASDNPEPALPVKIDLTAIEDRITRLTLGSTPLADAALTSDGETLVYLAKSEKGYDLWSLKLREKELKRLAPFEAPESKGHGFEFPQALKIDKEGKNVFVLVGGRIAKVGLADGKTEPAKFSATKEINGAAERASLFEHIWREVREKFYVKDLNGVDWDYYKTVYAKFLPYISDNRDFAEMESELLGELNASHTGCRYYPNPESADATAAIGAFFDPTYVGDGVRIKEVIEKGPLVTGSSSVKAGMIIEKINGVQIKTGMDISPLLNHLAGQPTLLTIFDPASKTRTELTIKPISLGAQGALLYDRWVKQRRDLVDKLSNGTVGYVHVRGMDDESYRDTYAEALGRESGKKALIVDTRYNGGGNLHDELATFLSGKRYLEFFPRGQSLGWEPVNKWDQKTAVIIGESNYSDAHLFPWVYQHQKIGPLVGMPVPGTGTAVWWESLQDPSLLFGIPEVGFRDEEGHFMEKTQVEPDVKVVNDAKSVAQGRDPQIEKAVEILKSL
jgi:tricorn protease